MIVNSIVARWCEEADATIDVREQVEVPEGRWAVMLKIQIAVHEDDMDYVHRSESTKVDVVSDHPVEEVVIKQSETEVEHSHEGGEIEHYLYQTICFHSAYPFVVVEEWDSPLEGKWVHFATRVRERGLSMQLPDMDLPQFAKAALDEYGKSKKPFKWCKLSELAELAGLPAKKVLELHHGHMNGYSPQGITYAIADSTESLRGVERAESSWTNPDFDALTAMDHTQVWVRKRFALVALYMKLIGWQDKQIELERKWAEDERRRKAHQALVQASHHAIAQGWMQYDTLQPVQG